MDAVASPAGKVEGAARGLAFVFLFALVLIASGCAVGGPLPEGASNDAWTTAYHDAERSNASASTLTFPLYRGWGADTDRIFVPNYRESSSPAITGWELYVGTTSGEVLAYELYTGTKLWSVNTGAPVESSPATSGREVCVGSNNGVMRCLSAASGAELWSFQARTEITSSPLILDSMVVFGSSDDRLYALDRATGAELWTYSLSTFRTVTPRTGSSPAYSDGRIFQTFSDSTLVCISADTGVELWRAQTGVDMMSAQAARRTPLVAGGRVYVINDDSSVAAYSVDSGELVELFSIGGSGESGQVVDFLLTAGGDIIIGSANRVTSIATRASGVKWTADVDPGGVTSIMTAGDHLLVVSNYTTPRWFFKRTRARIVSMDLKTGKVVWSHSVRGGITARPATAGEMLAFITDKGDLKVLASRKYHER
jgi:outer membrane protein assembly factor BamB